MKINKNIGWCMFQTGCFIGAIVLGMINPMWIGWSVILIGVGYGTYLWSENL